jgi:hypothetical protein
MRIVSSAKNSFVLAQILPENPKRLLALFGAKG